MSAEVDVRTDLDEATKGQLQPPCDTFTDPACPEAATWAVLVCCEECGQKATRLICTAHLGDLLGYRAFVRCSGTARRSLLRAFSEPVNVR